MPHQLKLANHVSMTEVDNEAVLVDLNSGAYFGLNHIGLAFVSQLELGVNTEAAIMTISADYGVEADVVTADIEALIEEMLNQKLLKEIS